MRPILIVDDEEAIAKLIAMTLARMGYSCQMAFDGLQAAELLEQNEYDLVLLDIMLPGADGYELIDFIRPTGIPVIFISTKTTVADRVKGLHLGTCDYIVKPFAPEELLARVENVLRLSGRGQALYFILSRQEDFTHQALGRVPLEGGDVQILYECGEHEQIEVAYTDGAGEGYKRPILLRSGEQRFFLVHRWSEGEEYSTWLYAWDQASGSCEPVKRLGSHMRFWGEYQGRAVLKDSVEPETGLFQLDAETGELTLLLSGENTDAAQLFLGPPLLLRENFICVGTMSADNPDGKERVYCLDLETGAVRQLASSDDGYSLIRMQDIWDGKLRVQGMEQDRRDSWYVDCATGQRVENVLADESGTPLHIRAQIGEYYLIDVERGHTTDMVWLNEVGEPVYSRDARRELALIAKEDYWAGRPDYRIFKQANAQ